MLTNKCKKEYEKHGGHVVQVKEVAILGKVLICRNCLTVNEECPAEENTNTTNQFLFCAVHTGLKGQTIIIMQINTYNNKTLGRAQDPRANGAWLSKLTE